MAWREYSFVLWREEGEGAKMKKADGFKTQPSTYSIGLAPTNRARCRLCKQRVDKGDVRIVTCAFVRPGRRHDFVSHARCATPALVRAILSVYGAVRRVPAAAGMDTVAYENACAQLERLVK